MNEQYFYEQLNNLLSIDSTIGCCGRIENYVSDEMTRLGLNPEKIRSGGVYAKLGGDSDNLLISAHLDDIGLMVRFVNPDGTLRVAKVGGLHEEYALSENCTVYTRDGNCYSGSIQKKYASVHVTEADVAKRPLDFATNMEVVPDMDVKTAADTKSLGIDIGSFVALDPRTRYENGFIKSRFVDDKVACAILLAVIREIKEKNLKLKRNVMMHFAVSEELGHGLTYVPDGVTDVLSVDIAPTGKEQNSDEHKVSIFAQDSRFPYNYDMTNELIACAKKNGIDYVVDSFTPHYGSDADTAIQAGNNVRHAAIGEGCANSHGYERTHIDGVINTYELVLKYITE
ncbi:MAG: M42 family metallopeptidase [Clostridia bacterium]|nr:M42 family metallopeptidase [Clostridia bacterium]